MRGDGSVYQRGTRWWISYWANGKRFQESAGTTEKDASRKLRRRLGEINAKVFTPPSCERVLVGHLLDRLVARMKMNGKRSGEGLHPFFGHMEAVREFFGHRRVLDVTPELVEAYQRERMAAREETNPDGTVKVISGKGPGTVNRELGVLRLAFRKGRQRFPDVENLTEPLPRQGFLEPAQVEALAAALGGAHGDAVRFAFASSWRREEVLGLKWEAVNHETREVRLATSKNGRGRVLPLTGDLWKLTERRWALRTESEFIFHDQGRRLGDFRKKWKAALKAAGVPAETIFHDLRRSGIRAMVRAGVHQAVAMAISGHRTVSVFTRYNITSSDDVEKALRKTDSYRRRKAQPSRVRIQRTATEQLRSGDFRELVQ